MKSIKSKVLVSLLAFALAVTSVGVPSVSAEAATNKKAVKSVTLKVKNKKVNKKTTTLQVGKTLTVKTTVNPSSAKKSISYKTSNKKIATVSKKGKVKGIKAGTAKITVTVTGKNKKKKSAWFKVKVTKKSTAKATATPKPTAKPTTSPAEDTAITAVTLNASVTEIGTKEEVQIVPVVVPSTASSQSLKYTSSNPEVATVSATGLVKAVKAGSTTITAVAPSGVNATINITVKNVEPTQMSLNQSTLDMTVEGTAWIAATFTPENANVTDITWSSADETVAKVDGDGMVTAIGVGTTVITAVSQTGLKQTCAVTVKEKTNENTDGITIDITNSLDGYNNTVFTGNNADIQVKIVKNGKAVGNRQVTLKMEYKAGSGNFWYISSTQNNLATVETDANGIASFTVCLNPRYKYDATDDVVGGYLLTATETGANTSVQAPLTFATFKAGDVWVDRIRTDLAQGESAREEGVTETKTIERRIIDVEKKQGDSEVVGTSEYVVSQQVSLDKEHAVTFNAYPLIQYPQVISSTDDADYKQPVDFTCESYSVYDTTQFKYITEVPANLNYATLNFTSLTISQNTALKIAVYKEYDKTTNEGVGLLKTYAIKGEHVEEDFTFQIPIQELSKDNDIRDSVCVKVYIQSQGQVEISKAIGYSLKNITGNYMNTAKYKAVSEIYKNAKINWTQVTKAEVGSDAYKNSSFQSKVTMPAELAKQYGIVTDDSTQPYYNAKVEYKVPTYPHIGNAYVQVTKPDDTVYYFMIPTEVVDNENVLIKPEYTQAFSVSKNEALNYEGSILVMDDNGNYKTTNTAEGNSVIVNSLYSGTTEVYGWLTVEDLDLTLEERRLYGYVNWAPIPKNDIEEPTDFYALVGQNIRIDVYVEDENGNPKDDAEVEFYLDDSEEKLSINTVLPNVTIQRDSSIFDSDTVLVKTDDYGKAFFTFNGSDFTSYVEKLHAKTTDERYKLTLSVAGTEASLINLHWIEPGLSFTDRTNVEEDETKDNIAQDSVTTLAYHVKGADAKKAEEQTKKINTDWLIGYQVVGLMKADDMNYTTVDEAVANEVSNVLISGVDASMSLEGVTVNKSLGTGTAVGTNILKISSEKTGSDIVKGYIDSTKLEENENIVFTLLNAAGAVIGTAKNVGTGEPTAYAELNVPIKWAPVSMNYEIVTPSGATFVAGDGKDEYIYVKVFDNNNNMLDDYTVTYSVKQNGVEEPIISDTSVASKKGLVPIKIATPDEECVYTVTATIQGYESVNKQVKFVSRNDSTVDFAMKTAEVEDKTITIELTDNTYDNAAVKEMFFVQDNKGKTYDVLDATIQNRRYVVLTLNSPIQDAAEFVNIRYKAVEEDINNGIMAQRLVSYAQSAVPMEDNTYVTAYTGSTPDIKVTADGVVTAKSEDYTLLDGAYVVFSYGSHVTWKKVTDGSAVDAAVAGTDEINVFTGMKSATYKAEVTE
ncbi:MAG: Ig domain-containing protein [Lachnospiraceae bacterium]|nr:Ig domain-containing protein [Lachnospiraceae bacterium]